MKLIKVNVLKEWVENWYAKNRFYHPYAKNNNIPITELYDILEQMPSAQPEPIKGKWLERSVDVDGKKSIEEWQSAKCSVCGRYHTTPFLYYFDDFNFCPNCGANMEGRE